MGFQKPLDKIEIQSKLLRTYGEIKSPYNDGFTTWALKQELYEIKWLLDEILKSSPTFAGEEEWLLEQHKKLMWSELKR